MLAPSHVLIPDTLDDRVCRNVDRPISKNYIYCLQFNKSELTYLQNPSSTSPRICKGLIDFDDEDLVREACLTRGVDGW